jgi:hypothetical protein
MSLFIVSENAIYVNVDEHKNVVITEYSNEGCENSIKFTCERFKQIVQYCNKQIEELEGFKNA